MLNNFVRGVLKKVNCTSSIVKNIKKSYHVLDNGKKGVEQRLFLTLDDKKISFWHDVDLYANSSRDLINMIVEVPHGKRVKYEVDLKEEFNPIKPDTRLDHSGEPYVREYAIDTIFNYGCLSQTYESGEKLFRNKWKGDNDPLDIIEMGGFQGFKPGEIVQVRILGCFCLIDQGELDWKILAISDKQFDRINKVDLNDNIRKIQDWFRTYKVFEGKKENILLDDNKVFTDAETSDIIKECNLDYKELMSKRVKKL